MVTIYRNEVILFNLLYRAYIFYPASDPVKNVAPPCGEAANTQTESTKFKNYTGCIFDTAFHLLH